MNFISPCFPSPRLKAVTMENEGGEETTQKDDGETEQGRVLL